MTIRFHAMTATAYVVLALGSLAVAGEASKPRTIGTHSGGIASVHFSPDGKKLVTGGGDRMIRLWDVSKGKKVREWKGPTSFTCAVRFSRDGKTIAAAGYETGSGNPIYRFDVATGKELPKLAGHPTGGVRRLLFTPDGKQLISGGFDGSVRVWDLATAKQVRLIQVESGTVYSIGLSPDGKTLATAGHDGLCLWDLATGKAQPREEMNRHNCVAVAWSPDGKLLASGDSSCVTLWEAATGKVVSTLRGYRGELSQLVFSRDGRTLCTASYDRAVRLWEVRTGRLVHEVEGHSGWVWGLALAPDEKSLASCSVDTKLLYWDLAGLGRPTGKKVQLSARQLDSHFAELASSDAGTAYRAVCALAGDPDNSLPMLKKRLSSRRVKAPTPADLSRMVRDLDSDDWPTREKASADLGKSGVRALPLLKKTLVNPPSLEVRRRIERLLRRIDPTEMPAEELVAMRGVQTLEYIGTPAARKLLEQLARGSGGVRLTEEASEAIRRMERRR
jgi:Tol biopolymer transport system component